MKSKNLCILFVFLFFFINTSHVLAEPYKSSKFPSVEILSKNIKMNSNADDAKYVGKRQIEKNVYKVFFSLNLEEHAVASVNLEKLDNDIWIADSHVILQQ